MLLCTVSGDVAQLGERDNRTVEVRGSSPLISIVPYPVPCFSLMKLPCKSQRVVVEYTLQSAHEYVMSRSSRSKFHAESSREVQGYIVGPNSPVNSKREEQVRPGLPQPSSACRIA